LRVLTANPLGGVRGPDGGDERQGQILYSDELLALLRGAAVKPWLPAVPLYRRQTYAMAVYEKARSSELEALTAADVDLKHMTITIEKQADRASKGRKGTKQTKTRRVRTVDIEPHVLALVEDLVARPRGKDGRLLHMPPPEDRAELLRKDLLTVGVTRAVLHIEGDPLQRAITLHDLRDTGLTHMAVRGDSPIAIQWAGGHTDFKTTQGYLDRGRVERQRIGSPLPPLPDDLTPPRRQLPANCHLPSDEAKILLNHVVAAIPTGIESSARIL
jgi:integrase